MLGSKSQAVPVVSTCSSSGTTVFSKYGRTPRDFNASGVSVVPGVASSFFACSNPPLVADVT